MKRSKLSISIDILLRSITKKKIKMENHPVTLNVTTYRSIVYTCVSSFKCHLYIYLIIPKNNSDYKEDCCYILCT